MLVLCQFLMWSTAVPYLKGIKFHWYVEIVPGRCEHTLKHTRTQCHVPWPPSDMKGAAALRREQGWREWIKITINRIKKNKYLAIIEAEWFIPHIHCAGWTAAPKKSICNYRHPTLGRSSLSIHLPPAAPHQHQHPQNKCQNSTQKNEEQQNWSLLCLLPFTTCTVLNFQTVLYTLSLTFHLNEIQN